MPVVDPVDEVVLPDDDEFPPVPAPPPINCENILFMAERLGMPGACGFVVVEVGFDVDVVVFVDDVEFVVVVELLPPPPLRGPHGFGNGCVFSVPACPFFFKY